ncbi:MAG: PfkB family carbohydrate kinase, partial [Acidimicrobiia bacterium]
MGRVVVVGSINQDVVIRVPHLPAGGETVLGHGHSLIPGGKGANQAVAAARIGAAVTMVGRMGDDAAGGMLTAALAAAGVDVGHIGVDGEHGTGRAFVLVDDRAQNAIALSPGANLMLAPHHLPAGVLADADVVSLQLEVPIA